MEEFEKLRRSLTQFTAIPESEWLFFVERLSLKRLKKDEYLFQQNEAVSDLGFVSKGLLYNFTVNESGNEAVKVFISEGMHVAAYSSLILKRPANFSCRTVEPTELVVVKYKDMEEMYDRHMCWQKIGRLSAEFHFIAKEERELQFLNDDAKTRYEKFVANNAAIINRIPQYLIASYIGISPVSLSRIRGQISMGIE